MKVCRKLPVVAKFKVYTVIDSKMSERFSNPCLLRINRTVNLFVFISVIIKKTCVNSFMGKYKKCIIHLAATTNKLDLVFIISKYVVKFTI